MDQMTKARFDREYSTVRRLVLSGRMPLKEAKEWIKRNGLRTATEMQQELNRFYTICWKSNPDMELAEMRKDDEKNKLEAKRRGEEYDDE